MVLLVFAVATPEPSVEMMTRFTVSLSAAGIPFMIILNKAELIDEELREDWKSRITAWGYNVRCVSVKTGEGLAEILETLRGKVAVVCGPSGVGKSSIINWMLQGAAGLDVGEVDVEK